MKFLLTGTFLLFSIVTVAQKGSLADMLWEEAGGRPSYSDAEDASRTTVTDEASNGYLHIYYEGQGCGCPLETTVAGYKKADGGYVTLKTFWDGCGWKKTISSNKDLKSLLPKDFGLRTFLPKSKETEYQGFRELPFINKEMGIKIPSQFIYSNQHKVLSPKDIQWLKTNLNQTEFISFDGGHLFPLEQPEKTADLIKSLIIK